MNAQAHRQIYEDLLHLDRGIAAAFRQAVGDNFAGALSAGEGRLLFQRATDGDGISPNEAKALTTILDRARFAAGAKENLVGRLKSRTGRRALFNGSSRELSDGERAWVQHALNDQLVAHITFRNNSGQQYVPAHFRAVARLIERGHIRVYQLHDSGLNRAARSGGAFYDPRANRLVIHHFAPNDPHWQALIVHEATHAIQDFVNRTGRGARVQAAEADAYTAQALALYRRGVQALDLATAPLSLHTAFYGTAKLIWERAGGRAYTERQFRDAYDALAGVISVEDLYKPIVDEFGSYGFAEGGRGQATEARRFREAMR